MLPNLVTEIATESTHANLQVHNRNAANADLGYSFSLENGESYDDSIICPDQDDYIIKFMNVEWCP